MGIQIFSSWSYKPGKFTFHVLLFVVSVFWDRNIRDYFVLKVYIFAQLHLFYYNTP